MNIGQAITEACQEQRHWDSLRILFEQRTAGLVKLYRLISEAHRLCR